MVSWPCEECTHDIIMTLMTKDENKNDHGATHDSVIGARGAEQCTYIPQWVLQTSTA